MAAHLDVWPQGKHKKKTRAADVGFVQEYGRRRMEKTQWMTKANEAAAPLIKAKQLEIWEGSE
jgi:hypothetical protein